MKDVHTNSKLTHQELFQLLPWYVNKTLQNSEFEAVEQHLTVCLTCKREFIQLQKLAQAVNQEGSLDSAQRASFARLKKRLHTASPEETSNQVISASDNISLFKQTKKRSSPWANMITQRSAFAMAAILLISLLIPRYIEIEMKHSSDYRTLSNGQQDKPLKANEIRLVFAEHTSLQQKQEILQHIQGQFVSTPTAQGVYTVRLASVVESSELLGTLESLKKDANIIFAEPAYALLSSTDTEKVK